MTPTTQKNACRTVQVAHADRLFSIGIRQNSVLTICLAVEAGKFALIAHGTLEVVARAQDIVMNTEADGIDYHESAA